MAFPITDLFSDCYIECEGKRINLHKCVLNARAPTLKSKLQYGDLLYLLNNHKYDDFMFAVKCIYDNDIPDKVTYANIYALDEFGNDELMMKALSRFSPTIEDIKAYSCDNVEMKYKDMYDQAIACGLRTFMNNKHEERSVVFYMSVPILQLAFPNNQVMTHEVYTYIASECSKYMKKQMYGNPPRVSIMASFAFFIAFLLK